MIRKIVLLFFVYLYFTGEILCNRTGVSIPDHKNGDPIVSTSKNLSLQIDTLIAAFVREANTYNHEDAFDSLASLAVSYAESTFDDKKMLEISRNYFRYVNIRGRYIDFEILADRAEQLLLETEPGADKFDYWLSISNAATKLFYPEIAHKFALKAISESGYEKDPARQVRAILALGKSLELQKFYIEAYQNFLEALYNIEKIDNIGLKRELKMLAYDHLFDFHSVVRDYDHAAQYKNKEIKLIEREQKIDSVRLMWAKYDLCGLLVLAEKYRHIKTFLDELIHFSNRENEWKLRDYTFSLYRTYLNKSNDHKGLYELYYIKYPNELKRLEGIEPVVYFQTLARIAEFKNNLREAFLNYEKAINSIQGSPNPLLISNFYKRYGQFLLRNGMVREAKNAFLESFEQASKIQYLSFMEETSKYLDTVSVMLGEYKDAHKYAIIHRSLLIRQNDLNQQTEFLKMELSSESRRMELQKQRKEEALRRKHNLQYFLITILITAIFLLFILLNRFRVPAWLVKGLAFLNILMIFELIILFLDQRIHYLATGEPIKIFILKVLILVILFPLHHVTEEAFIRNMTKKQLIFKPSFLHFRHFVHKLWPWLDDSKKEE